MKLISGALILFLMVSIAYGLKCYSCANFGGRSCRQTVTCPAGMDRCSTLTASGITTTSCMQHDACKSPVECCKEDLCNGNGAIPTGPSVLLLMLTSAIITFFV